MREVTHLYQIADNTFANMPLVHKHLSDPHNHAEMIRDLFQETFGASEGPDEGRLIGTLADSMVKQTADNDLFVFVSQRMQSGEDDSDETVGCIIFSRLKFDRQPETAAMLLGPVGVRPSFQKQGIGKALIQFGLKALKEEGTIDLVVVYGNPKFYSKVSNFVPISTDIVPAPMSLSKPHGWQALSLAVNEQIQPITGTSTCVTALGKPDYW
jgi:putative acetyltransferase